MSIASAPTVGNGPRQTTDSITGHAFHWLPATQPPWFDTGFGVEAGESLTVFADGRVFISRALDLWVGPSIQLWYRIGERGPIFRGTRATNTLTARESGSLWLANYFPGEWTDPSGRTGTPDSEYARLSGGTSVLLVKWARGTEAQQLFRDSARDTRVPGLVLAEAERFDQPVPAPASGGTTRGTSARVRSSARRSPRARFRFVAFVLLA